MVPPLTVILHRGLGGRRHCKRTKGDGSACKESKGCFHRSLLPAPAHSFSSTVSFRPTTEWEAGVRSARYKWLRSSREFYLRDRSAAGVRKSSSAVLRHGGGGAGGRWASPRQDAEAQRPSGSRAA